MGPFSVTGQPNAMGGREVGGLANQLAAHMRFDDPDDRAALTAFWNAPALAPKPGLKAVELFDAVADGRIKAIWIVATNPAASMPRAERVRAALAACPFVVVSDCWPTDTTGARRCGAARRRLGREGRHRHQLRTADFAPARVPARPGEARPDWWQFAEVGRRMGWAEAFAWDVRGRGVPRTCRAVRRTPMTDDGCSTSARSAELGRCGLRRAPPPCPLAAAGGRRQRRRAVVRPGRVSDAGRAGAVGAGGAGSAVRHGRRAVLLNTGRVRDQWHTMTRTGLAPNLMTHTPEPMLTIHPADAAAAGIEHRTPWRDWQPSDGDILLRAELRHSQRRGEVFAPMHWTDRVRFERPRRPGGRRAHAIRSPASRN